MMKRFLLLVFFLNQILKRGNCAENWPSESSVKIRHKSVKEGQNVNLKCAGRRKDAPAFWDYKNCGTKFESLCSKLSDDERSSMWKPISHNKSLLTLTGVTSSESGLYRCKQAATPLIYVYTTIELVVTKRKLPQFLDNLPKNITVRKNSQAVFKCKIYSKTPAQIMWMWHGEDEEDTSWMVSKTKWLELMGTAGEMVEIEADGTLLSRLVLPRVQNMHAGQYFCFAFNTQGVVNSSAYLMVIDENESKPWCLYLLFLLPIGFAMIPITLWFCLVWIRKYKHFSKSSAEYRSVNTDIKIETVKV